ncbi:hypothetical protein O181_009249 [Austropuccinia psidii MF-1]|uniref:Uncharacterized protein n=1 Tax=Austropuccinia psidii MF-1 TaxID=1389203 RepID=A0A9Q3BQG3_9BASI|nr:hypothetical protein [Austropuccinia psidii MF-1]
MQRQGKKDKELVEEPKSFISIPKEGTGDDPSFGERRANRIKQLQKSSRTSQRRIQGPQNKKIGPKKNQGKGKGKANWKRPYKKGYRLPDWSLQLLKVCLKWPGL